MWSDKSAFSSEKELENLLLVNDDNKCEVRNLKYYNSRTMGRGSGASEPQLKAGGGEQTTLTHMYRHGAESIGSFSDFSILFRLFYASPIFHILHLLD